MCNSVLFCDLRRPLTVEDYLGNNPISAFTDIVTSEGVGGGAGAGEGVGGGVGAGKGVGALTTH